MRRMMGRRLLSSSSSSSGEGEVPLAAYWRDLESRVTRRKPRPLGSGPSGRGERRVDELEVWTKAGLFDFENSRRPAGGVRSHGRLSTARVKSGQLEAARLTYETTVAPVLRNDVDLVDLYVVVDARRDELTSLSVWATPEAFSRVANTFQYREATEALAAHFDDLTHYRSDDVETYRLTTPAADDDA
eukprot:CAMPEP_0197415698 /NCGR_PEP_ID=MMETSP1170-20131217/2159_1 /TAXON_ID=54406 /ORGANISM="Sarcinochrysis sp, Strain CCMP770" /LENGTH=187 /DNA_ID=CAMNT_0042942529 /DNA_START=6 /DNA_END=569 /DNA_ORIENTATION=-